MMVTIKRILKAIGNENLTLYRVNRYDYYVFAYDTFEAGGIFETESVYLPQLNRASIYWWVRTGQEFVKKCKEKEIETNV